MWNLISGMAFTKAEIVGSFERREQNIDAVSHLLRCRPSEFVKRKPFGICSVLT